MCCVLFKQRQRLVFHLRAKHKIGKAFSCPTCKREDFSSYDVFNNHKKKSAAWTRAVYCIIARPPAASWNLVRFKRFLHGCVHVFAVCVSAVLPTVQAEADVRQSPAHQARHRRRSALSPVRQDRLHVVRCLQEAQEGLCCCVIELSSVLNFRCVCACFAEVLKTL